jgi:hypothetical protein
MYSATKMVRCLLCEEKRAVWIEGGCLECVSSGCSPNTFGLDDNREVGQVAGDGERWLGQTTRRLATARPTSWPSLQPPRFGDLFWKSRPCSCISTPRNCCSPASSFPPATTWRLASGAMFILQSPPVASACGTHHFPRSRRLASTHPIQVRVHGDPPASSRLIFDIAHVLAVWTSDVLSLETVR